MPVMQVGWSVQIAEVKYISPVMMGLNEPHQASNPAATIFGQALVRRIRRVSTPIAGTLYTLSYLP